MCPNLGKALHQMAFTNKGLAMLHETLRVVLLETADAYRALTEEDVTKALDHLRNVQRHAENHLQSRNQSDADERQREAKIDSFSTEDSPIGYSTIAGFCLREGVYDWRSDDEEIIRDSLADSREVLKLSKKLNVAVAKWEAPQALREVGIQQVNIYADHILRAVLVAPTSTIY